jgi:hypothetical protein
MNERIKELAQQCWDKRLDGLHFDQEKFAELVIGHCCPKRQWVGLTPEEVKEISFANRPYVVDMVVALEARLKEKNT